MAQFKKRVFGENVSKEVINEFKKLAGGSGTENLLDEINPTFEKYLGERTPFSRMWCAVNINTYSEIPPAASSIEKNSKGEYFYYINPKDKKNGGTKIIGSDKNSKTRVFSVNENKRESYVRGDLDNVDPLAPRIKPPVSKVAFEPQLRKNPLFKPEAGITSVTSRTQGALGALQNTTVEFVVHNKHDFENIFLPYFLKPGSIVCVDYGWSDLKTSLYDPINKINNEDLEMSGFDQYLYGEGGKDKGFLANNYGKVNTVMGNVTSYEANINTEGSYECSLEIVSRNTNLLDKEVSEDNELKFIFSNVIHDVLVNVLASSAGEDVTNTIGQLEDLISSVDPVDTTEFSRQFLSNVSDTKKFGVVSREASRLGIFHQNMVYKPNSSVVNKLEKQDEMTYISYGLFEDLFLNNLVAGTVPVDDEDKDRKPFSKDPTKDYSNKFDSRLTYIRWDAELFNLQLEEPNAGEGLHSFILPSEWDNSYNYINLKLSEPDQTYGEWKVSSDDDKNGKNPKYLGNPVMPLRDLFISVPLITNAFKTRETVNDAIIFIMDQLNLDSHKVWNLKVSSDLNSKSNVSITDTNLMPEIKKEDEMLIFDVTGETSIVSQCDLKFTTPKAGLSSMIAIGNLNGPKRFDQLELSALNHLNLLNRPDGKDDEPTVVKSLPLQGVTNKTFHDARSLNFDKFVKKNKRLKANVEGPPLGAISTDDRIRQQFLHYKQKVNAEVKEDEDVELKGEVKIDMSGYHIVTSDRDYRKAILRKKNYEQSAENRVSPILPVELDLSVYGNRYLQIGDYYTINYLPKHYKDRVFFQIMGIEDKVDVTGWTTSYTSVMRVRPDKKQIVSGRVDLKDIYVDSRIKPLAEGMAKSFGNRPGGETIINSFTRGYKPLDLEISNANITMKCFEYLIAPMDKWLDEYDGKEINRDLNNARCFETIGQSKNGVGDLNQLAYNCAIRDAFFAGSGKKHKFFKDEFSIKPLYSSYVADTIERPDENFFVEEFLEKNLDEVIDKVGFAFGNKKFENTILRVLNSLQHPDQYVDKVGTFFQDDVEIISFYSRYFCRIPELKEFQKITRITASNSVTSPDIFIPNEFLKVSIEEFARFIFNRYNELYQALIEPRVQIYQEGVEKKEQEEQDASYSGPLRRGGLR